jgi:hypothetical protein
MGRHRDRPSPNALFLETKGRIVVNVVRIDKNAVYGLFFVLICFAGLNVLIGLLDRQLRETHHRLEHSCPNFIGLDRLGYIRAAIKADNNDLAFTSSFKSRVCAERHRVVTRYKALYVWELLDDRLRFLESLRLIPVRALRSDFLQVGVLA